MFEREKKLEWLKTQLQEWNDFDEPFTETDLGVAIEHSMYTVSLEQTAALSDISEAAVCTVLYELAKAYLFGLSDGFANAEKMHSSLRETLEDETTKGNG